MTDLFSDQDTPAIDPNKAYLEDLVGEGKKFRDAEALAKGKAESDAFIEKLQGELSGLRQELNTRLKLEEVVDRISSSQKSPSSEPEPKALEKDEGKSALTPEQIQEMVAKTLSENQKSAQRVRNMQLVEQKLQEAFGPTFRRTIKEQVQKLGLGEDFAKNLAAEQPNAFLKLFDVTPRTEAPSMSQQAPRTNVNPEAFGMKPSDGMKRQSHYEALRKKDPAKYWSVPVQNEMHKEAQRQGESFFD